LSFIAYAGPAEISARIRDEIARQKIPGASAAVVLRDGTTWTEGFGYADLENDVKATPKTMYRLASVSKTFTAVLAVKLAEEGRLDLDREVSDYCPAFPKKTEKI